MSDDPQHQSTFGDTSLATCPKCGGLHMRVKGCQCDAAQQSTVSVPSAPIQVWAFNDAPEHLRALSTNGGNEDWIALLPHGWGAERWLPWAETGTPFGCCSVDEYEWHGLRVLIGSHA